MSGSPGARPFNDICGYTPGEMIRIRAESQEEALAASLAAERARRDAAHARAGARDAKRVKLAKNESDETGADDS